MRVVVEGVCVLVFDIPLHAARGAMAAVLPLPKLGGGLSFISICRPRPAYCRHTSGSLISFPTPCGHV